MRNSTANPASGPGSRAEARISPWKLIQVLACGGVFVLLSIGASAPKPANHESAFSQKGLITANASALKATVISPHTDAPLVPGTNVFWCGSFQLAWNEACNRLGEDVRFTRPNAMADALNRKEFTREDLDPACFVALAGFAKDGILEKIPAALKEKFGGAARPRLLPTRSQIHSPYDLIAYAYLFKNLQFDNPFARLDPLKFGGKPVACFGFEDGKPGTEQLCSQVLIHDYKSPDDFVIELTTKSRRDRVILAKVAPRRTLAESIAAVKSRSNKPARETAFIDDTLKVPKMNCDLTRRYTELEGNQLILRQVPVSDCRVTSAVQNIRFQMDERGVVLRSEAHMVLACSAPHRPAPKHIMVFDRPFLILLEQQGASAPYFALWVDNPELLLK